MAAAGELHMELCLELLGEFAGIEIIASPPVVRRWAWLRFRVAAKFLLGVVFFCGCVGGLGRNQASNWRCRWRCWLRVATVVVGEAW